MKKKFLILFLLLCNALSSWGLGSSCHQAQTRFYLTSNSTFEQKIVKDSTLYNLIKMDRNQRQTAAYQRAETYLTVDYIEILRKLGKDEAFIEKVQAANQDLLRDSQSEWYVLLASDAKNPDQLIAGAAFVIASKPGDLLPMEKEIGKNFIQAQRPEYPVAEAARVGSVNETANPDTFKRLTSILMEVMTTSNEIKNFYVFTSRGHQALYRHMGYKFEKAADEHSVSGLPHKDVILRPLR